MLFNHRFKIHFRTAGTNARELFFPVDDDDLLKLLGKWIMLKYNDDDTEKFFLVKRDTFFFATARDHQKIQITTST